MNANHSCRFGGLCAISDEGHDKQDLRVWPSTHELQNIANRTAGRRRSSTAIELLTARFGGFFHARRESVPMSLKFDIKDWIALATAVATVGSVVWKGGQITQQLEATAEAVRQMAPVVNRLDAMTARLEVRADSNKSRIEDLTKRVENLEERRR